MLTSYFNDQNMPILPPRRSLAASLMLAILFFFCIPKANADDVSVANIVRFNTVCANCHEGECSGRLSFHTGVDGARGHMQRYLGNIEMAEAEQLFALLQRTKKLCTHYPVAGIARTGKLLGADDLTQWHNLQQGGYFIPLGELNKGKHRLRIDFATVANGKLKITDRYFEPLLEEMLCSQQLSLDLPFESEAGPHYLSIFGENVVRSLMIEKSTQP